jgi:plasmid stabilization system protein ParE
VAEFRFLEEAAADAHAIYKWYLKKSQSAAENFRFEMNVTLRKVMEMPTRWPEIDRDHRHLLLERYPVSIVYRISGEQVVIVAVWHAKRRKGFWRRRKV